MSRAEITIDLLSISVVVPRTFVFSRSEQPQTATAIDAPLLRTDR